MEDTKPTALEHWLLVLVLALSLGLRLAALDVFVTSDEDNWHKRSLAFRTALQERDWQATYQTGHPGVLTMWAGAAAEQFPLLQQPPASEALRRLMRAPASAPGTGVPPLTLGARRLIALLSWLGIVALFPLLRKLFGPRAALIGTGLVALDPFFLAHSRLHHLDAILTIFTLLSVACLLVYRFRGRRWGYLVASGAAAGLAVANKSPGVFLAPWAGLVLLLPALLAPKAKRRAELAQAVGALALWGLVAAAALVAVWPAMWVSPVGTLRNVVDVALFYAETPHKSSNFFWFSARADPGPLFYPVAWAIRATPWVLLGLVGLIVARRRQKPAGPVGYVLLWVLLFGAAMTTGDKKFDRYLLPVFPWLDVLAGMGWIALLQMRSGRNWGRWAPPALATGLALGHLALALSTRPYYLSCYNHLLGGSQAAPGLVLVGWGEGLEQAAAYLNNKPDAAEMVVSSWQLPEFGEFFVGRTVPTRDLSEQDDPKYTSLAEIDYFVFYRNVLQREIIPEVTGLFVGREEPEHVVRAHGIDYAWIYRNTAYEQAEQEILAQIAAEANPAEDVILLDLQATFARDYSGPVPLAIHTLERDDAVAMALQRLSRGRKHIWHLVYPDFTRRVSAMLTRHLQEGAAVGREVEAGGLRAVRYDLPAEPRFVPAAPSSPSDVRFGEQLTFAGYDAPKAELEPGSPFHIRLHWEAGSALERSYVTFIHVIGPEEVRYGQMDGIAQGWTLPTTAWQPGERVLDDCEVAISTGAPPGEYVLALGLYDAETHKRLPIYDAAGNRLENDVLLLYGFRVAGE